MILKYIQGEAYTKTNGKIQEKKVFSEMESCCKKECFKKVGLEKQNELFKMFWECGNYTASNMLLYSMMAQKKSEKETLRTDWNYFRR